MQNQTNTPDIRIAVCLHGFVSIGYFQPSADEHDPHIHLSAAQTIRKWGTTRGLGQLAIDGPTNDTVLDPEGFIDIPKGAGGYVKLIRVQCVDKWVPLLK